MYRPSGLLCRPEDLFCRPQELLYLPEVPLVLAGRSFVSTKVSPASTRNQKDQKDNASQTSFCVGRRTSSVKSLLCRSRDLPCRSVSLKDPLVSARAEGHLCQLKDLLRWSHGLLRLPESFFCRSEDLLYWPENLLCRRGNFLCWPDDFCGLSNALRRDFFGSWVALAMVVWCGRSQGDHFLPLGSCCWPLWASQRSLRAAKGQDYNNYAGQRQGKEWWSEQAEKMHI